MLYRYSLIVWNLSWVVFRIIRSTGLQTSQIVNDRLFCRYFTYLSDEYVYKTTGIDYNKMVAWRFQSIIRVRGNMVKIMNVGIIGFGKIARKYVKPIQDSRTFHLKAICDLKKSAEHHSKEYNALFFTDYQEMLHHKDIDVIIITTPPETHFDIAENCILHGKNVILEKPAALHLEEVERLLALSKQNQVKFDVIFHWKYGNEVLYIKDKWKDYGEIKRIETTVLDPYTDDAYEIKEEYVGLEGSWYDCGINCLSFLSCFVDVRELYLLEKTYIYDQKNHLDIYSRHNYNIGELDISITIDWRYRANHKYTHIYFHKDVLYVDHSSQTIFLNNELLVDLNDGDRLENHYKNYLEAYEQNPVHDANIYDLHYILLRDK